MRPGELDIPAACAVLELETDLRTYRASLTRPVPESPPSPWQRAVKRLWFKVFQMSASDNWSDVPAPPVSWRRNLRDLSPVLRPCGWLRALGPKSPGGLKMSWPRPSG